MLKILIVEDNQDKLCLILKSLAEVDGFDLDSVTQATNGTTAKKYLRTESYDLLILDIMLPNRMDQEARIDEGIRLLEEIEKRPVYNMPTHIVGITAYPEIFESTQTTFSQRLLSIVLYDPTTDEWSRRLQEWLRHIVAAKNAQTMESKSFCSRLCIICALHSPELDSVLSNGWNWEQYYVPNDDTIYYRCVYHQEDKTHIAYAAAAARKGMSAAATLASKMIYAFRPEYLSMVGITAGFPQRTRFGDVIVADPSWDWGSGKWVTENNELVFLPSPHQIPLASAVRNRFVLLCNDTAILADIRNKWLGDKPDYELSIRIGPLASGAAVLADGTITDSIKKHNRDILGVEMETYGIFSAADEAPHPKPTVFSIKSVVDFATGEKDDHYHRYAAFTSAMTLTCFMEKYAPKTLQ